MLLLITVIKKLIIFKLKLYNINNKLQNQKNQLLQQEKIRHKLQIGYMKLIQNVHNGKINIVKLNNRYNKYHNYKSN